MNTDTIVKWCDRIVMSGMVVMAFIIPLCVDHNIWNRYSLVKILLMYALTSVLSGVWLIKMITLNDFRLVRTPIDFPVFAFLACSIFSTIFSIAPIMSLLGTYDRYDGLLTLICYIMLYYLVVNFFQTKKGILWLLGVMVASGTISSVYGILQYFDVCDWTAEELGRVASFFGNPIFYAASVMMAFLIGLGIYCSFSQKESEPLPGEDTKRVKNKERLFIIILCICLLIIYWGFSLATTRSCYLGIFAGIITFLCLGGKEMLFGCKKRLIILGVGICLISSYYNFIEVEYSVIKRFAHISPAQESNNEKPDSVLATPSRIFIWKTGMEIIKDYPFLGIGPETIKLVYLQYLVKVFPEKYFFSTGEYIDRMHNEFLDYAVTRGIVGLAIYLWGILSFFAVGWRFYKGSLLIDRPIILIFIVVALALLVQVQFNFSVPELSYTFAILAGGMIVMGRQSILSPQVLTQRKGLTNLLLFSNCPFPQIHQYPPDKVTHSPQIFRWIYYIIAVGTVICFLMFIHRIYMADKHYLMGKKSSEINTIIKEYRQAADLAPYEMEYYNALTRAYIQKRSNDKSWTRDAITRTRRILQYIPLEADAYFTLGSINYILAKDINDTRIQHAIRYYETAVKLNPFFVKAYYNMAAIYYKQKRYDAAIKCFKKVHNMLSIHIPSCYRLAECYAIKGNSAEASKYLKELKEIDPDYPTARLQGMIDSVLKGGKSKDHK
ncbi:O-antigen ligase family protein [Candidatus Desantisbacteria bacterium]|nr:O-antigen ligase family protein [Candidatus Desantisbacteria bacterium]